MGGLSLGAWLLQKALTPIGTYVIGFLVLLGSWKLVGAVKYQSGVRDGERTAVEQVNRRTEEINAKVRQARDRAGGSGADERLRQQWCVDCNRR